MPLSTTPVPYICLRCVRQRQAASIAQTPRTFTHSHRLSTPSKDEQAKDGEQEQGAMSRLLAELSEQSLETGGRSAQKAIEEAGFDDDLKRRLQERIAGASFKSQHAGALAQAELPASAGRHTRDIAAAAPWSGTESVHDASLRMLNDSVKPMKPVRGPAIRGPPRKVDTGRSKSAPSSGARLANARDKTSAYAFMKDLPEDEREQLRKEMRERFTPAARSGAMTVKGLESLANERIEDAIARGKFRNLPRGKVIERDHNASSPFIDSTEYLLNRMIQRQDIVPPWIEKQQEIVSTVNRFRGRLRNDWKRHVARTISSKGGSLESQMRLADEYAKAEAIANPKPTKKTETINTVNNAGHLSQITLAGELKSTAASSANAEQITITEHQISASGTPLEPTSKLQVPVAPPPEPVQSNPEPPSVPPFRDPDWLRVESSYHKVAIENLNTLTRSYNLMCPALAQRPYFLLERELNACYAEVAPQIAGAIKERASAPRIKHQTVVSEPKSVLGNLAGPASKVYDEVRPQFGFRELWREWFGRK